MTIARTTEQALEMLTTATGEIVVATTGDNPGGSTERRFRIARRNAVAALEASGFVSTDGGREYRRTGPVAVDAPILAEIDQRGVFGAIFYTVAA